MDLRLSGRTILVTGGSSGVGLALVKLLVAEGANVLTCARDSARLAAAVASVGAASGQVTAVVCNVGDRDQVEHMIERGTAAFGGLDGVVHNAGRASMNSLDDLDSAAWMAEFDSKFAGVLNVLAHTRDLLRASPIASMVMINATLARQPDPRLIATGAARAALLNLTKSLAAELARERIRVNSVCLGLIDTGQWRRRYAAAQTSQDYQAWIRQIAADRQIPLGRLGSSEEVAPTVALLLSPLSSYTTGTSLDVCGGTSSSHV